MENSTNSSNYSEVNSISSWSFISQENDIHSSKPNPNIQMGGSNYYLFKAGCKDLSSGKKRGREILYDDPLEDTASSLVNGPKEKICLVGEESRKDEMELNEGKYICNALRKRGLCLVPMAMLVDYLDNHASF